MKSLALVCAVVIALNRDAAAQYEDYYNDTTFLRTERRIECSRVDFSHRMKNVRCMPRDTMVKLTPPQGFAFYPDYAIVKRCDGFCTRSKSCIPLGRKLTKVAVRMYGFNTKQCYHELVEEHTRCKCLCSVQKYDCNKYQQYSENNCACECMNRRECDASRMMIWDEKMCKCGCNKPEEPCSSGLEWLPSRCRCVQVMDSSDY